MTQSILHCWSDRLSHRSDRITCYLEGSQWLFLPDGVKFGFLSMDKALPERVLPRLIFLSLFSVASNFATPEKVLFWNTPGKPAKDVKCGFQKGFESWRLLGVFGG